MTDTTQELIHSLRNGYPSELRLKAADTLEALQAEVARQKGLKGQLMHERDVAEARLAEVVRRALNYAENVSMSEGCSFDHHNDLPAIHDIAAKGTT